MRVFRLVLLLVLVVPGAVWGDTLMIVGVAVKKDGQRVPGVMVRLYATANRIGRALAEDRTSERGIFNLYLTNIAGDIGELFVVYEGSEGVAEPLRVSLRMAQTGLLESRPGDLTVLPIPQNGQISTAEASERMTAVANTQQVLVRAGVTDQQKAEAVIASQSTKILDRLPPSEVAHAKDATIARIVGTPVVTGPSPAAVSTVETIRAAKRSVEALAK